jgi:hypothetical protein
MMQYICSNSREAYIFFFAFEHACIKIVSRCEVIMILPLGEKAGAASSQCFASDFFASTV